jgi:hypothetical protein
MSPTTLGEAAMAATLTTPAAVSTRATTSYSASARTSAGEAV